MGLQLSRPEPRLPAGAPESVLRPLHRRQATAGLPRHRRDPPGTPRARPDFPTIREELMTVLPNKATIPRYHDIDPMQAYISAPGDPDKAWKIFYLYAMGDWPGQGRRGLPEDGGAAGGHPRALPGVLLDPRGGQVDPGPRGALSRLSPLSPRHGRPRARSRPRSGSRTRPTPGARGRASSSTIAGSTRSSTQCAEDRVVLIVDIRRPMPLPLRRHQPGRPRRSCASSTARRSSRSSPDRAGGRGPARRPTRIGGRAGDLTRAGNRFLFSGAHLIIAL